MSSSPDPVAALGDAWRRAREAFCFSSVRGREATGTHLLRIGNYSTVASVCSRGNGRATVMLRLLDNRFLGRAADATAAYRVAFLDGEGSTVYSTSVVPAKAEERKQALRRLKDDSLSIRCDVTVQGLENEARVRDNSNNNGEDEKGRRRSGRGRAVGDSGALVPLGAGRLAGRAAGAGPSGTRASQGAGHLAGLGRTLGAAGMRTAGAV
ncbi:BTB/POZ and MATH domain-containing protein 2-like [Panicum miliaceum]|uniref:BTB/POZ and MATH domain-containing protein 2-like n=1 Tax=Panicum miliaceum TaxID=4540 RepID=A0A3L6PJW4_PANMI|nr:BTB/POZ and MATH domain-containing protein 2-like [Panicum miliaceum]